MEVENDKNVLFRSRYVVNAAGLHADEISRLMGDDSFSISGRKGEYMLLDRAASGFVQRVIFQAAPAAWARACSSRPRWMRTRSWAPRPWTIPARRITSVTQAGLGLPQGDGPALHAGRAAETSPSRPLRASAPSPRPGDFILGVSPANPRLIQAAGICSPGLSSAPAIALETVEALRRAGLFLPERADFNPIREHAKPFRTMTEEEREQAIAKDPRYEPHHLPVRDRDGGRDRPRHRADAGQAHGGRRQAPHPRGHGPVPGRLSARRA